MMDDIYIHIHIHISMVIILAKGGLSRMVYISMVIIYYSCWRNGDFTIKNGGRMGCNGGMMDNNLD